MVSGLLALFIFFVCPWLFFKYIGKKTKQWSESRKREKRKKEENKVIARYEDLVRRGVELYRMGSYILEKSYLSSNFDEEKPFFIRLKRSIMIALPVRDSQVQHFESNYRYFYIENSLKDIYNNKDITKHFSSASTEECEDVYGDAARHYNYAFIANIGQVQRNEEWTYKWEISVIVLEILKRVGVIK